MFSRQGTEALPGRAVPGSPGICMQAQVLFLAAVPSRWGTTPNVQADTKAVLLSTKKVQADT